jgi:hypothetical protein
MLRELHLLVTTTERAAVILAPEAKDKVNHVYHGAAVDNVKA